METSRVCQCCLSEGLHRDLNTPYVFLDRKEIYSVMLLECFNISPLPDGSADSICDLCIKTLRESCHFKNQVQRSQEELTTRNKKGIVDGPMVKIEKTNDSDNESDDYFLSASEIKPIDVKTERSDDDSDNYMLSDSVTVKKISTGNKKVKNVPIKKTKNVGRIEKAKVNVGENKSNTVKCLVSRLANSINSCEIPVKLKKRQTKTRTLKPLKERPTISLIADTRWHRYKYVDNLKTILQNTNAIPFKNKTLLGYICSYCDAAFPDPANLRVHTEEDHKKKHHKPKTKQDMIDYSVKLDVTDLTCNICEEKFDNLSTIGSHLVNVHKKVMHTDVKDVLLQFKLKKGDVYDCAMCSSTYETFKMLIQHMNIHYSNYQCDICDSGFATRRSLNTHRTIHIDGCFKCEMCEKVFSNQSKRQYHMKMQHLGARNISNCPYCDEPFRNYYQRNQHLTKVHNLESRYKCNICDKDFMLKSLLMSHVKKNHLMERNAQCAECGYKFFSNRALKKHMVKHTGEKNYACDVCHKTYARKYTLTEHMRIHNNDRRFKCDVCAMTFVQKCSLKSHLLSNHGISLAASEITSL